MFPLTRGLHDIINQVDENFCVPSSFNYPSRGFGNLVGPDASSRLRFHPPPYKLVP